MNKTAISSIKKSFFFGLVLVLFYVVDSSAAQVAMEINPDPVHTRSYVLVTLTVSNDDGGGMEDVQLILKHDSNINASNATTGGSANSVGYVNYPDKFVTWSLNDILPGESVTVSVMFRMTNWETTSEFQTELWVNGVQQQIGNSSLLTKSVMVKSQSFFRLVIDETMEPEVTGVNHEYILSYSYVGTVGTDSSGTKLTFPLPAGATVISTTGGGVLSSNNVYWDLGTLSYGEGGERRVTLAMSGDAGDLIEISPVQISGVDSNGQSHNLEVAKVTSLNNGERPELAIAFPSQPVQPTDALDVELTVSNPTSTIMNDVELHLRYPYLPTLRTNTSSVTTGGSENTVECIGDYYTGPSCNGHEIVKWNLKDLSAGESVTVNMLTYGGGSGDLTQFQAEVWVDGVQMALKSRSVRGTHDAFVNLMTPLFELSFDKTADPVTSGSASEYALTYGNVGDRASDTELRFPLPTGATFVNATGNGVFSGGDVVWDLGSLADGAGGQQRVTVNVDGDEGDILEIGPIRLSGIDSEHQPHAAAVTGVTSIKNDEIPDLTISVEPLAVEHAEELDVAVTISNPTSSPMDNVKLFLRYPDHLVPLNTSSIPTGESDDTVECIEDSLGDTFCGAHEIVKWGFNSLPAGGSVTVTMKPEVSCPAASDDEYVHGDLFESGRGTLIRFKTEVWVGGRQATTAQKTVYVGDDSDQKNKSGSSDKVFFPIRTKSGALVILCI